jgi:putative FmdB family regulatory protein
MLVHEYTCNGCGHKFAKSIWRSFSKRKRAKCPKCTSSRNTKLAPPVPLPPPLPTQSPLSNLVGNGAGMIPNFTIRNCRIEDCIIGVKFDRWVTVVKNTRVVNTERPFVAEEDALYYIDTVQRE